MSLIQIAKKEKEPEYKFTNYEKLALELLPEGMVKASEHSESLLDKMLADEVRDADPEHTKNDIYRALEERDVKRLLAASKNLTVQEKNKIVQGLYTYIMQQKTHDKFSQEDAKRISILAGGDVDLFDLCVQLDKK